ncbi:unnamed protein product [Heligmosomoides polygyrus]|uniref:Reverse transcriptase domain-containing protein n=1 Tax=Heligmosomoides polygyrus TaxID=6339 RepID=A0A183GMW6_HELPZ|nr:unnamed protein product [Heligmosomoides polygyrus]
MKDLNWDDNLVDGKRISNLRFADDIVLISTSTAEVEEMLNELNVAGMKIGLDMNMSKTRFMVNQWCDTGLVRLNGVALQQVDSYGYLGRELNMDNDLAPEIARRRRAAWDGNLVRQQHNRQSDANYASCTGEMSSKNNLRQQWQEGLQSSKLRKKKSQLADPLQYMKKSKYRWARHLLRRKDGVSVLQNGSRETIRNHWDDRQRDGQTHSQDLSESGVCLT